MMFVNVIMLIIYMKSFLDFFFFFLYLPSFSLICLICNVFFFPLKVNLLFFDWFRFLIVFILLPIFSFFSLFPHFIFPYLGIYLMYNIITIDIDSFYFDIVNSKTLFNSLIYNNQLITIILIQVDIIF